MYLYPINITRPQQLLWILAYSSPSFARRIHYHYATIERAD
jgi:hypothetical protein